MKKAGEKATKKKKKEATRGKSWKEDGILLSVLLLPIVVMPVVYILLQGGLLPSELLSVVGLVLPKVSTSLQVVL